MEIIGQKKIKMN